MARAISLVAFTYPGYVIAGYAVVVAGLAGYFAHLLLRSRRAKARVEDIVAKRAGST